MVLAHKAGLFEAKENQLRSREEDALHGGTLFVYVLYSVGLIVSAVIYYFYPQFAFLPITIALGICLIAIGIAACKRAPYAKQEKLWQEEYEGEDFGAYIGVEEEGEIGRSDDFYFTY